MQKNFVRTTDAETAEKLKNAGLQLVNEASGIYTFLNYDKFQYATEIDAKKLNYSDVLCV